MELFEILNNALQAGTCGLPQTGVQLKDSGAVGQNCKAAENSAYQDAEDENGQQYLDEGEAPFGLSCHGIGGCRCGYGDDPIPWV
jgi:hypothetical protein